MAAFEYRVKRYETAKADFTRVLSETVSAVGMKIEFPKPPKNPEDHLVVASVLLEYFVGVLSEYNKRIQESGTSPITAPVESEKSAEESAVEPGVNETPKRGRKA